MRLVESLAGLWRLVVIAILISAGCIAIATMGRAQDAIAPDHEFDSICCSFRDCGPVVGPIRPVFRDGQWIIPAGMQILLEHGKYAGTIHTVTVAREMGAIEDGPYIRIPAVRLSRTGRLAACVNPQGVALCLYIRGGY